jgi:hypothetical protein
VNQHDGIAQSDPEQGHKADERSDERFPPVIHAASTPPTSASGRLVISRDELLNKVWGYECYPSTRTVDTHILTLRRKLENDPADPAHLVTIHGLGYKFMP